MEQQTQTISTFGIMQPSQALAAAVYADSNLELDWLWTAGRVSTEAEKMYCYQRALHINPGNRDTERALWAYLRRKGGLQPGWWTNLKAVVNGAMQSGGEIAQPDREA